jgi:hypothetical protein
MYFNLSTGNTLLDIAILMAVTGITAFFLAIFLGSIRRRR